MKPFSEAYFPIRNKLRKFSRSSIINAAFQTLRTPYKDKMEEMQSAPAQILLLVKWTLQDRMMDHDQGPEITPHQFGEIRQRLWEVPDEIGIQIVGPERPMRLFLRRMLRSQMGFQVPMDAGFVREAALLATLPANHGLIKLWKQKTGLELDDFMTLLYAMFAFIHADRLTFDVSALLPVQKLLRPEAVRRFLKLIAPDMKELSAFLRQLPDTADKKQSELYEFPVLSRFPFLSDGSAIHCWHPALSYRGMESLVHSIMSDAGERYIRDFSKVFEKHVLSEARTLAQEVYSESDIQRWTGDDEEVVDALVAHRGRNVLIEAKAGLFAEVVMAVAHSEIFLHKTRALPKAVSQGWATSLGVRQSRLAPELVSRAEGDYLLIVTNRELSTGEGTSLVSMYPEGTMKPENSDALMLLPLENIFVLSISDFERLAHAVRHENLDLVEFLGRCVAANRDGQTSRLYIGHHLDREKIPRNGRSKLVNDAIDACRDRLASMPEKH